jgi:hypothetical protein
VLAGSRPPEYAEVKARHETQIEAVVEAVRAAYRSVLLDLIERI